MIIKNWKAINDFMNQQKSANTNEKTAILICTLFSAVQKLIIWKMRIRKLPWVRAWPPFVKETIIHIINNLLTSLARDRTVEYWPSVVFATTTGQYSPVRPSRSVSKRLKLTVEVASCHWNFFLNWSGGFFHIFTSSCSYRTEIWRPLKLSFIVLSFRSHIKVFFALLVH